MTLPLKFGRLKRATITTAPSRAEWWERILWLLGGVGVLYCAVCAVQMIGAREAASRFAPLRNGQAPSGELMEVSYAASAGPSPEHRSGPAVVGRVEIPAIGLVTPLLDGDDSMSLAQGAGHIPGTALPGGLGTVGIAGHRDTHFRLLGKVTPGMDVRLVSRSGVYHYRVTSSEIVSPDQVSVLAIGAVPSLALVTCYPFRFIGHAPKRFIVHATLLSAAPDE